MFKPNNSIVFWFATLLGLSLGLPANGVGQETTLPELNTAAVFEQPPYPKIRVVERLPGWDRFTQGMPESWKRYARFSPTIPRTMETDIYRYPACRVLRNKTSPFHPFRRTVAVGDASRRTMLFWELTTPPRDSRSTRSGIAFPPTEGRTGAT